MEEEIEGESVSMSSKVGHAWPYMILAGLAYAADRLSKMWAADFVAENGEIQLHTLLTIRQTYNRGIALGLFQGIGPIIGWLTIGVVLIMLLYLVQLPEDEWLAKASLALVIGGAMGNLIDRITAGEVLDFIQTPLRAGIFNVADVLIYIGIFMMFVSSFLPRQKAESHLVERDSLTQE